jgi:F-type H+/Na+-transporting ATPase subunit beta
MVEGKVIQIIGPAIDVEFPEGQLPAIYNALKIVREGQPDLILEVQMHLGENKVRTVAMDSTDGLVRNQVVYDTEEQITVPVGEGVLGRILNVIGEPIDEKGPVITEERYPIHRQAPAFENLSTDERTSWSTSENWSYWFDNSRIFPRCFQTRCAAFHR